MLVAWVRALGLGASGQSFLNLLLSAYSVANLKDISLMIDADIDELSWSKPSTSTKVISDRSNRYCNNWSYTVPASSAPTKSPTFSPTTSPTSSPTSAPTEDSTTKQPTLSPTKAPTNRAALGQAICRGMKCNKQQ